jgi:hypothetical protein
MMSEHSPEEIQPVILNAGYDIVRDAPVEVRRVFDGIPAKALLKDGEALFRFLQPNYRGTAEGFWLTTEAYHALRIRRELSGIPLPGWAIAQTPGQLPSSAPPNLFCRAVLAKAVYGFRGPVNAAAGPVSARSCFWIPGLSSEDVYVRCYALSGPPPFLP